MFKPNPATVYLLKMLFAYVCCIYSSALQTKLNGSKKYEPRSDNFQEAGIPGPYCLQYRLAKPMRQQMTSWDWQAKGELPFIQQFKRKVYISK